MRDVCDIAYVLWWGRLEREHLALWQASVIAGALGSTIEVSTLYDAQRAFDAELAEPPARRDRVRDATLRLFSGRGAA